MNKRIRLTVIALHVIAALNLLLVLLLVIFSSRQLHDLYGLEFGWKVVAVGVTLAIGAEIIAWALKKEKKWARVLALLFCCLYLLGLLLPLSIVSLSGSGGTMAFVCKSGFVDCTGGGIIQLCKSAKIDCGLGKVKTVPQQELTFNINVGDHVAPDKPVPGAGRIQVPGTIHRYQFTVSPETTVAIKVERPCTFGSRGSWALAGPSGMTLSEAFCRGASDIVLKEGGTYSLTITPGAAGKPEATGEYAFTVLQLIDATEDVQSFMLNIGDHVAPDKPSPGAGRIETAGSLDRYTFTLETSSQFILKAEPPCSSKFNYSVDDSGIKDMMDCSFTTTIPVGTGAHTIVVSGRPGETGDYGFVLKVPVATNLVWFKDKKCHKPIRYDPANSLGLTAKVKEIVDLQLNNEQKVEKLVQLSTEQEDIVAQAYRLCEEYGNGITDQETYAKQEEIISSWRRTAWEK